MWTPALATAAIVTLGSSAATAPNPARSVLLTDAVQSHGARCLDGSPQRFWLQESQSTNPVNRSKWYFHLMGGGACVGMEACTSRAYDPSQCYRGSSSVACFNNNSDREPGKPFEEEMDFLDVPCINGARWGGGLLMQSPISNPLTHDWNKIEMQYCDGNSYAGNQETVSNVSFGGRSNLPLYFRGKRNVDAVVDYLKEHHALESATHFVLSGDSAGGIAAYWHADYFSRVLPKTKVLSVPDSGFFISYVDCANCTDKAVPNTEEAEWYAAINASAGLDQSCIATAKAAGVAWNTACLLPEKVAPHVSTPLFVMNSRFDAANSVKPSTDANFNAHGSFQLDVMRKTVFADKKNAGFVTSCHEHCGQWATGQVEKALPGAWMGHSDYNVTIRGVTAGPAVDEWAKASWEGHALLESERVRVQAAHFPCESCCNGGDPQR